MPYGLKRKVQIYTTDRLCTPVVYGLIRPRIILPAVILKESSQSELRHIITHELVHIKSSIKDPNHQFWVKASNLFDDQLHQDINYGIITAKEVNVVETTRKQGNLIRVLIKDKDKSCVTIPVIDINLGKTGWIDNKDYTIAKSGVYFNQAFLKKGTKIYTEPSANSPIAANGEVKDGGLFVFINTEQGDWVSVSSYEPINGWVKKDAIFIPIS